MTAEEFLKGLDAYDKVFDSHDEYEYTEDQLINFAKRYAEHYHRTKVESVSDEEIEKYVTSFLKNEASFVQGTARGGAQWMKQKLLKPTNQN